MELLELLSDDVLRDTIGADLLNQAYRYLNQDFVIDRVRLPDGELSARWNNDLNSPVMRVRSDGDRLMTKCSCREFQREATCIHIDTMLVAWIIEPSSFLLVGKAEAASEYADSSPSGEELTVTPAFDVVGDFKRILNQFTVAELREIARIRSVSISGIRKDPIIDALALAFSQRDKFRQDWSQLPPNARLLGGLLPFIVTYMNTTALAQVAQPQGLKDQAVTQAIEDLRSHGMIAVDRYGGIQYPAVLPVWIPPDPDFVQASALEVEGFRIQPALEPRSFFQVVTRLLVLLEAAPESYLARAGSPNKKTAPKAPMLQDWPLDDRDASRLAQSPKPYQFVQQEGVRVVAAPSLLTNEVRQKLATAMQAEPDQVDLIVRVLHAFNLLQVNPGKPVLPRAGVVSAVLQEDTLKFLKQMLSGYVDLETWTDFDLAMAHHPDFRVILRNYNRGSHTQFLVNARMLRQRAFLLLRRVPAGKWYSVDSLAKRFSLLPLQMLLRSLLEMESIEINGRRVSLDRGEDIQKLLAHYLESMISGPLYWQGMVDLAWEKDRLAGFRVAPLGAALMAHPVDFQMPAPAGNVRPLELTPQGDLILHLGAAGSSLVGLAMMLGNVNVARDGGVTIRPTLVGAGRAFTSGWTAERILDTLSAEAGQPVPQALESLLQRWWQNYGSVQIYQDVALMEFGDDYALGELLAGTSLSRYLLYRFSPRLIAIRPEGAQALRDELVKKGYTPKIT